MAAIDTPFPVTRPRYTGILEWVTTVDHKRIGALYLWTTFFFFVTGGLLALALRAQLATPDGQILNAEAYNAAFTMHGTTMIFLFVVPVWTGFANYIIPLQIGARDMAFPKLNALSYWLLLSGGIILYSALLVGPPASGWTSYVPLSTLPYSPSHGQDLWLLSLTVLGFSSIFGALNMIVTIFALRAPGMTFSRITLFTWSVLVTSFLLVLAIPFLTVAGVLLLFDRLAGLSFFATSEGSDPLLWQFLFWFFGHPEVYIMVLPGFGVVSEILPVFSRKPIFGYKMIAYSSVAIGFLSFSVFVHHMFVAGVDETLQVFFMISTMLIAVPTGVKIFSWLGTIWHGSLRFKTPMLFALGFIATFTIGGISGVFLGAVPEDVQLSDTYYVVAHIHYVLFGGAVMTVFAAMYYWIPKMSGRMLNERLGQINFLTIFVAMNLTFFPQHELGIEGMPRRIFHYPQSPEWGTLNLISTIGAFLIAVGVAIFLWNFFTSVILGKGKPAGDDPWEADTLEWATTSPPPVYNFPRIPVVHSARPLKEDQPHT
ncbi:MAG TPA: cytochrome c oxidase subunit I [Chloroflexi bacterium]|jgi:cytochrome c oxidase subunit 1|nr:cytochrome c oxidase subunit I [Chloroflexota bacterium]HAL28469.1 cytochrome c oxidase subunit I [Chloroflexota bacterium]